VWHSELQAVSTFEAKEGTASAKWLKRKNRINEQFSARLIGMLESPAYRALSLSAHKVISRLEIELAHHGGNDNGKLPCTYLDFIEYGINKDCIAPAIRESIALGFIKCTRQGHGGNADCREESWYLLTFAHARGGRQSPPTHDWRRIKTFEEALQIAKAARADKSASAIKRGQRTYHEWLSKGQKRAKQI
jgi:hypothetical protein